MQNDITKQESPYISKCPLTTTRSLSALDFEFCTQHPTLIFKWVFDQQCQRLAGYLSDPVTPPEPHTRPVKLLQIPGLVPSLTFINKWVI